MDENNTQEVDRQEEIRVDVKTIKRRIINIKGYRKTDGILVKELGEEPRVKEEKEKDQKVKNNKKNRKKKSKSKRRRTNR